MFYTRHTHRACLVFKGVCSCSCSVGATQTRSTKAMPAKKAAFFGASLKACTKAPKAVRAMTTQAALATQESRSVSTEVTTNFHPHIC